MQRKLCAAEVVHILRLKYEVDKAGFEGRAERYKYYLQNQQKRGRVRTRGLRWIRKNVGLNTSSLNFSKEREGTRTGGPR